MSWLYLSFAIVAEVIATLSLRATEGFQKKLWIIPMAVFYVIAFFCLALTLVAGMPVAIAYGIWSAVGVALIALLARVIWKEQLTPRMVLGLVLIMVGVILVEIG
ncbi:MAG: multidrug efflux SMR transporter [Yaniella sp.]|uniref:DMT family transporter n=1 Tax=Yaniella sp. TaxID=2773929 RepID=UPI001799E22B|nr:multidrug efflux SMR transporter [Yaniella sp.]NLZ97685.1 multidrug efflux SMR transporter [Micrococcus sp.]MDN5704817.1 multidrug efflux SMR transporter [Yaniella sp.]MDN5730840.1 multidrug efflux SMR transporter [Yaniella sp.]MDN5814719.1 multidrug efflux SMR transporter [Yaniella sp.]MDN5817257.1 multidrug efflux SMR transporter [Yaniella sp.]